MTVKTDKLNENQTARLVNDLMIENYQLNGDTLNVYFNEDIVVFAFESWMWRNHNFDV